MGKQIECQGRELPETPRQRVSVHFVLLVEDDCAVGDATSMMLEAGGYQVHTATHGPGALSALAEGFRPDFIIADYRLPGQNGVDVVRAIRTQATAGLPAIIVTGDTSASQIIASGLPYSRVLRKPVHGDRLLELIEQWSRPDGWQYLPQ